MPTIELTENQVRDLLDCIDYRETGPYSPYEHFFRRHLYLRKALKDAIGLEMYFGEPD